MFGGFFLVGHEAAEKPTLKQMHILDEKYVLVTAYSGVTVPQGCARIEATRVFLDGRKQFRRKAFLKWKANLQPLFSGNNLL